MPTKDPLNNDKAIGQTEVSRRNLLYLQEWETA